MVRPDAIRGHNLSLALAHVHRDGQVTRAELTQRLGLSRSTVGALVAHLTQLGLVEEVVPSGGSGVGRPSHVVVPHHQGPFAFGVDIDLTSATVAAIGLGGQILARTVVDTADGQVQPHPDPEDVVARVVAALDVVWKQGRPGARPCGLGVSVPGTVDRHTGRIGDAPNLGWRDVELAQMLAKEVPDGVPVVLGNDADLALLAEHRRGSVRGCEDAVFLMGRGGVGAGIMASGVPLSGRDGHAGEIGHNPLDPSGPRCHCGKHGCLELYLGEDALLRSAGHEGEGSGGVSLVFSEARDGRRQALEAVQGLVDPLGRALGWLLNTLNPERVVLGGSLADVFELVRAEVAAATARYCFDMRGDLGLVAPALGRDSALYGAAEVGFARLLADPR
ncbi:MAG TPA: ROK family transcriptional regulator [Marmoricola sp.]